jgi:hypothetical protein
MPIPLGGGRRSPWGQYLLQLVWDTLLFFQSGQFLLSGGLARACLLSSVKADWPPEGWGAKPSLAPQVGFGLNERDLSLNHKINRPMMTENPEQKLPDNALEAILNHGLEGLPQASSILINQAMSQQSHQTTRRTNPSLAHQTHWGNLPPRRRPHI